MKRKVLKRILVLIKEKGFFIIKLRFSSDSVSLTMRYIWMDELRRFSADHECVSKNKYFIDKLRQFQLPNQNSFWFHCQQNLFITGDVSTWLLDYNSSKENTAAVVNIYLLSVGHFSSNVDTWLEDIIDYRYLTIDRSVCSIYRQYFC